MTIKPLREFTRESMASMFASHGYVRGAEIGVKQGQFSEVLCQAMPGLSLLCVDSWSHYPSNPKMYAQSRHDANYRMAQERLAPYGARLLKGTSMAVVATVQPRSLDFVYIDANHAYRYVLDDLKAWERRVRPGGVVSGDDFTAPGVRQALDEWTGKRSGMLWLTTDPSRGTNRNGDTFTSWFYEV